MMFNNVGSSSRGELSTHQTLELANFYLENAWKTKDRKVALVLCDGAVSALLHAERDAKRTSKHTDDQDLRKGIASAYSELGKLQDYLCESEKAQESYKTARKWG